MTQSNSDTPSVQARLEAEREALQDCETTPIHDIGTIQPFGYLVAAEAAGLAVTHASTNCETAFERPLAGILGADLSELFERGLIHRVNNALGHSTIAEQREHVGRVELADGAYDVMAHVRGDTLLLELQPVGQGGVGTATLSETQRILQRLQTAGSVDALLREATREVRHLTGFHRVKAYRFLSDGAGEVVAESREPQAPSFLGLRFPAYDIPKSARALYVATPIRCISAVGGASIPIAAADPEGPPLDLSLALLRGTVPVHDAYLQNMGVGSTISLPIVVDGAMWGLIACHHLEARRPDSEQLCAAEIVGGTISMLLETLLQRRRLSVVERVTQVAAALFVPDGSYLGYSADWTSAGPDLASLLPCDGVALVGGDRFYHHGLCPPEASVRALAQRLRDDFDVEDGAVKPIALDALSVTFPDIDCGELAGMLAIPDPALTLDFLIYFRRASGEAVRWAGQPKKDIVEAEAGFRLNPRASFAEYQQTHQDRADPFEAEDIVLAESLMMSKVAVQMQRLGLVIRELNHRVRNILALIGSIMAQSRESAHDLDSFVESLERRIESLSETQRLLTETEWKPVDVGVLLERSLVRQAEGRVTLSGPALTLSTGVASLLALVVNELASNAAKYGALSSDAGQVTVSWERSQDGLTIRWVEQGGPVVRRPTRRGFGMSLIEEALPFEFDAECALEFDPRGLRATFRLPLEVLGATPDEAPRAEAPPEVSSAANGFRALVLEDDYVIAKEMSRLLTALGARPVDLASTVERALSALSGSRYDIAFLDANVRGRFSGVVAAELRRQGVPFAFVTGYGSSDEELKAQSALAIVSKPIAEATIRRVLKDAGCIDD